MSNIDADYVNLIKEKSIDKKVKIHFSVYDSLKVNKFKKKLK